MDLAAQAVQVGIVPGVLADLVQQVQVVGSLVRALQVEHRAEDQVDVQIQLVVVETQLVHWVNLVAGHQRGVSQSAQSVKSSTT